MKGSIVKAILDIAEPVKKPTFVKEFNDSQNLINQLESMSRNINDKNVVEEIESDIRFIKAGVLGEKNVAYELQNSFIPMLILHDVLIQDEDYQAQLDFVIITHKFICILETKKLNGNITINNQGEFIRTITNKYGKTIRKEGMYSPVSQNQRHVRILKNLLLKEKVIVNTPVLSLIVLANPKSIINNRYAPKEIKDQIVKYDLLTRKLKKMFEEHNKMNLSNYIIREMANYILNRHVEKENSFIAKYKSIDLNKNEMMKHEETALLINKDHIREKLVEFRLLRSREEKIKAYYIFNNKQMENILDIMPSTIDELQSCDGFGPAKCKKYGQDILGIINQKH